MGKDLLYQAMKTLVKSDVYKPLKIKASAEHDLYKMQGDVFWNAFYCDDFLPAEQRKVGVEGFRIDLSVKGDHYDELQYYIIHPHDEFHFTDKVRANSGAMCRAQTISRKYALPFNAENPDYDFIAQELLKNILSELQNVLSAAERTGGLNEYFIAHAQEYPRLAGLACIEKQDYDQAVEIFTNANDFHELFLIRPETDEQRLRLCKSMPEQAQADRKVFQRDYRYVYLDYCRAMQHGIVWNGNLAAYGLECEKLKK